MKFVITSATLLSLALVTSSLQAKEEQLKSGPQAGESVGTFTVEKCAGNKNDNVEKGQKLCYRCMLGNRPVVAVFVRRPDKQLTALLKEIDSVVAKNEDKKLASFVNLLGEDKQKLKSTAESLVRESKIKHIAVVVPEDHAKGPENYKLNPKIDLTVVVYKEGKVEANFAMPQKKLNKDSIKAITLAAAKLVKSAS